MHLDVAAAEQRLDSELKDNITPDKAFDRQWAAALLNAVLNRLAEEYSHEGKTDLFEALKQTLAGARESQPYAELAQRLAMNEGAVRTAVHRLRKRYWNSCERRLPTPRDRKRKWRRKFGIYSGFREESE